MEDKDFFKDLIKNCLEEEIRNIHFTDDAKDRVKSRINEKRMSSRLTTLNSPAAHRWIKPVYIPLKAVSLCLVVFVLLTTLYSRAFFYVSPQELARFENRQKIIVHDGGVPFGAVQHLIASSVVNEKRGW